MTKATAAEIVHRLRMVHSRLGSIELGEYDLQEMVKRFCESAHELARVTLNEQDLKELGIRATALKWDRRLTLDEAIAGWEIVETPQGGYYKTLHDPYLRRVLGGA